MLLHLLTALAFAAPARAQDLRSWSALAASLSDPDPAARAEAAFRLGQLGLVEAPAGAPEPADAAPTRAAAAQALTGAASDPDAGVRRAAVEALGKVGGPAEEAVLLAAATDADAGVRGEAALAFFRRRFLKRVPEYSTAAVTRLTALMADPDPEARWRAAYAFARWSEPRAQGALAKASRDADARARLFAVRALSKIPAAPDAALLSDPDAYVRAETLSALAASKAWDSIPDSVFADPSPHVRAAAADAAGESGKARFVPLLRKLAAGEGALAPGRALIALAHVDPAAAAPVLAAARKNPRWWLRARAYEASALLPDAEKILIEGTNDADPRVAAQALETLAPSTAPVVLALLDQVLRDPKSSLEMRGTAVDAASERKDAALADALIAARPYAVGPGAAELRGSIREALEAIAQAHPETESRVKAALKDFPALPDKPRRFRPLKKPATVVLETEKGTFAVALATDVAPNHAAMFAELARKGFYDGLAWHRVVTAFVVQGGDPRGSGWGDAGWRLADENSPLHFARGAVGAPKAGPDTAGCQLFVSLVPTPHLDGRYTVFGRVVSGLDVLDRLEPGDRILHALLK